MEGGRGAQYRFRIEFESSLVHEPFEEEQRAGREQTIIEDAPGSLDELRIALQERVSVDELLASVEIADVDLRHGSIVVEISAVITEVGSWLVYFGAIATGIDYLARALRRTCQIFLGRFAAGSTVLTEVSYRVERLGSMPLRRVKPSETWLVRYLIISTAALLAALIFLAIRS